MFRNVPGCSMFRVLSTPRFKNCLLNTKAKGHYLGKIGKSTQVQSFFQVNELRVAWITPVCKPAASFPLPKWPHYVIREKIALSKLIVKNWHKIHSPVMYVFSSFVLKRTEGFQSSFRLSIVFCTKHLMLLFPAIFSCLFCRFSILVVLSFSVFFFSTLSRKWWPTLFVLELRHLFFLGNVRKHKGRHSGY